LKKVVVRMLIVFADVSGQLIVQTFRGILMLEDRTKTNKLLTNASQLPFTELVKTAPQRKPKISKNPSGQWQLYNSARLFHILTQGNPTYDFLPQFLKT
jgi:hypothetical protein